MNFLNSHPTNRIVNFVCELNKLLVYAYQHAQYTTTNFFFKLYQSNYMTNDWNYWSIADTTKILENFFVYFN